MHPVLAIGSAYVCDGLCLSMYLSLSIACAYHGPACVCPVLSMYLCHPVLCLSCACVCVCAEVCVCVCRADCLASTGPVREGGL